MSTDNTPGNERRARRSTRLGIALLIVIALIIVALVWAFQADDDPQAPAVNAPVVIAMSPADTLHAA